jgi:hypothetical protein
LAATAWRRAALAATGWFWVVLAGPLGGADLYTNRPRGTPEPDVWIASLSITVRGVIKPFLTSGALSGAAVWALAAVVLPWVVRGRSLPRDLVLVSVWAAATVSATEGAIAISSSSYAVTRPPTAIIGAVAGALLALVPAAHSAWRDSRNRANVASELP